MDIMSVLYPSVCNLYQGLYHCIDFFIYKIETTVQCDW
jgi:hypothetical protein